MAKFRLDVHLLCYWALSIVPSFIKTQLYRFYVTFITVLDIIQLFCLLFNTRRFGDWILSSSSGLLFSRLKIKLKGRHFDTTEVNEAKSQAMLNTLTEHGSHDAFKNDSSAGNCAYAGKGTDSRVKVANTNKVNFCPDGSTSS
jgi:hypothetical protein